MLATGKPSGQFVRLEACVGYVAAAATGNANLGKELRPLLENGDFQAGTALSSRNRGEEASCAATDDCHSQIFHVHRIPRRNALLPVTFGQSATFTIVK